MNKMNSINKTAKLCREYNIGISRSYLLQLTKSGAIPCVKVGQKILINWEKLMQYLDTNTLTPDEEEGTQTTTVSAEEPVPGIRKISA